MVIFLLLVTISISIVPAYSQAIVSVKKYKVTNSPEVCGDELCEDKEQNDINTSQTSQNSSSPLAQYKIGISLDKIQCKLDFHLVLKTTNWRPACVKISNVIKLVNLGWAINLQDQDKIIEFAKSGYSLDVAQQFGIENVPKRISPSIPLSRDYGLNITPFSKYDQKYLMFEGFGWRGFHVVTITITSDTGFFEELKTKTSQAGDLHMPWPIPEYATAGKYHIIADDKRNTYEIDIPVATRGGTLIISNQKGPDKCTNLTFPIDWSGCDLYGKILQSVDLRFANLQGANIAGATLTHKDLTGADLTSAHIRGAILDGAILKGAIFVNANLMDAKLRNTDLTNANLRSAKLFGADLTGSNLTNADLRHATLTNSIFAFTDLRGANLEGTGTWKTNLNHCINHEICR